MTFVGIARSDLIAQFYGLFQKPDRSLLCQNRKNRVLTIVEPPPNLCQAHTFFQVNAAGHNTNAGTAKYIAATVNVHMAGTK